MLAHTQALRHFRNRIAPLGVLRHCIPLELFTEIPLTHHGLFASNLGKKTSTSLGAIHLLVSDEGKSLVI